jgi:hypothetical protein
MSQTRRGSDRITRNGVRGRNQREFRDEARTTKDKVCNSEFGSSIV